MKNLNARPETIEYIENINRALSDTDFRDLLGNLTTTARRTILKISRVTSMLLYSYINRLLLKQEDTPLNRGKYYTSYI